MKQIPDQKHILLENILAAMDRQTFSMNVASKIVGGHAKLFKLIEAGKVDVYKNSDAPKAKWQCNARQVLEHCRNMRG